MHKYDNETNPIGGKLALSPLFVFLCLYLVTSFIVNDFYKVPISVAFMFSSCYAVAITKGLSIEERIKRFSHGACNTNIMMMVWIFILAGAFAQSAKDMGAIEATVNLTLSLLPENLLLAGIFIASCFVSISVGTSVGTIVALTPVAVGISSKTGIDLLLHKYHLCSSQNTFLWQVLLAPISQIKTRSQVIQPNLTGRSQNKNRATLWKSHQSNELWSWSVLLELIMAPWLGWDQPPRLFSKHQNKHNHKCLSCTVSEPWSITTEKGL